MRLTSIFSKRLKTQLAEHCPVEFPANLVGSLMPQIKEITQHEKFEIRATPAKTNAANTHFAIGLDQVAAPNLDMMIDLVEQRSRAERIIAYTEYSHDNFLGYCMTCGKALVSEDECEVVSHISLNVWAETEVGFYEGAPEQFFCSWTHLHDFLVVIPDSAHLWMCMQYMYPGSMRSDGQAPAYIARAQDAASK